MPTDPTATEPEPAPPPRRPRRAGVVALALVGLALTAGITYAASTLVSQPIGLTSEPATVGDSLAPGAPTSTSTSTSTSTTGSGPARTVTTTVTVPEPVPVPVPVPTTSTSGGDDRHGGDDGDHDDD